MAWLQLELEIAAEFAAFATEQRYKQDRWMEERIARERAYKVAYEVDYQRWKRLVNPGFREQRRMWSAAWFKRHPKKHREYQRKWRLENRDEVRAAMNAARKLAMEADATSVLERERNRNAAKRAKRPEHYRKLAREAKRRSRARAEAT